MTADIVPMLKFKAFAVCSFYAIVTVLVQCFLARGNITYIFVNQVGVPLVIFEMAFLGLLTSLILPLFMKVYGTVVFTTYKTMLTKGFDEAQTAKEEGRLFETNAGNDRTWYDQYS